MADDSSEVSWRFVIGLGFCAVGLFLAVAAVIANSDYLAFQAARPCAAHESPMSDCYAWQPGRVMAVSLSKTENETGTGQTNLNLTVVFPVGRRTIVMAAAHLPRGRPAVGESIQAKIWRGQVADVKVAGVTVGAVSGPVTRYLFLVGAAVAMFGFAALFFVAVVIDRRAGFG